MTEYKVSLDAYSGPLDLLLYLIRREEVDIYDIPIASVTEQYVAYVGMLTELDPEAISEFLVLAATLMEIKSRTLLPRPPVEEDDGDFEDPRLELVRQLLEYKQYKDAARNLEAAAHEREARHARQPAEPPAPPDEYELENLEIWDLFDAFRGLLEQIGKTAPTHQVGVDDTPLALHADDILDSIQRAGNAQPFAEIFAGRGKAEAIGLFLALLELIRQRRVRVSQDQPADPILIHLLDARPLDTPGEAGGGYGGNSDDEEEPEERDAFDEANDAPVPLDTAERDELEPAERDALDQPAETTPQAAGAPAGDPVDTDTPPSPPPEPGV